MELSALFALIIGIAGIIGVALTYGIDSLLVLWWHDICETIQVL